MDRSTNSLQEAECGCDDAPEIPQISCEKHIDKHVEYYCADHKTLICETCKDTIHRKCTFADLDKEAADMKKSGLFEAITKQLETIRVEYSKLRTQRNTNKADMEVQIEKCINEIKESRNEINNILDALETKMMENVAKVKQELSNDIEKHCKTIDETLKQLDSRRKLLELCQKSYDNKSKYFGVTYVKSEIQEMQQMKSDIEMELREVSIKYHPCNSLKRLIKQAKQFGKIVLGKVPQKSQNVPSLVNLSLSKP